MECTTDPTLIDSLQRRVRDLGIPSKLWDALTSIYCKNDYVRTHAYHCPKDWLKGEFKVMVDYYPPDRNPFFMEWNADQTLGVYYYHHVVI